MEHELLYGPPANRKLDLVTVNDSRLSIRPVTSPGAQALACMLKPHAPGPTSGEASDAPEVGSDKLQTKGSCVMNQQQT